ncbi:MAG: hypothetical protein Tsb0015_06950 [Simkaniaceae bacterium]
MHNGMQRMLSWISTDLIETSSFLQNNEPEMPLTLPSNLSLEEQEKFLYTAAKIDQLKNQLHFPFLKTSYQESAHSPWVNRDGIGFGKELLRYDYPSIDFFLAHEFSHIKLRHFQDHEQFYSTLGLIEALAILIFFPLLVPLEVIAFFFAGNFHRRMECDADAEAVKILGNNLGAKQAFTQLISFETNPFLENIDLSGLDASQKQQILTAAADFTGYTHPSLIQRLKAVS